MGIQSVTNATLTAPAFGGGNVFTATVSIPGVEGNATTNFPTSFHYRGRKGLLGDFLMSLTFTYPDNKVETISANMALV